MPSGSTTTSAICGSCRRRRCCRNGGTSRGLPISCFLNEANDSLEGIVGPVERECLAGGPRRRHRLLLGQSALDRREGRHERQDLRRRAVHPRHGLADAGHQPGLAAPRLGRRATCRSTIPRSRNSSRSAARPAAIPTARRSTCITASSSPTPSCARSRTTRNGRWLSPKDGAVLRKISARALWIRILTARIETGEPYLIFVDHVNNARPEHHKLAGLEVKTSNLCSEITLPTGIDHHGKQRTAVCCLSSLNLETYLEWHEHPTFIEDVMRFLDNVLQGFIDNAPAPTSPAPPTPPCASARSASASWASTPSCRPEHPARIGDGQGVEQEDVQAHPRPVRRRVEDAGRRSAAPARTPPTSASRSASPTSWRSRRPPRSRSSAAAPRPASSRRGQRLQPQDPVGLVRRAQPVPREAAGQKGSNDEDTWTSITTTKGSVQHLDFLDDHEKAVFKTAFEIDQRWLIEHAADRTPYICQSQSLNIFLPADVHKRDLHQIHMMAWKRGVKSLYYCRSLSIQRADNVSDEAMADRLAITRPLGRTPPRCKRPARRIRRVPGRQQDSAAWVAAGQRLRRVPCCQ